MRLVRNRRGSACGAATLVLCPLTTSLRTAAMKAWQAGEPPSPSAHPALMPTRAPASWSVCPWPGRVHAHLLTRRVFVAQVASWSVECGRCDGRT